MNAGDIHAVLLIAVVILAAHALAFGRREKKAMPQFRLGVWVYVIVMALWAANVMMPCLCHRAKCATQVAICAPCGILILLFGRNRVRAVKLAIVVMTIMVGLCIQFNLLIHGVHYTSGSRSVARTNYLNRTRSSSRISDCVKDAKTANTVRPSGWVQDWPELDAISSQKRQIVTVVPQYTARSVWHTPLTQLMETTRTNVSPWWPEGSFEDNADKLEFRQRDVR